MDIHEEKLKAIWQQYVCFKLGKEEFGVEILKVREIVRIQSITHVPQTPNTVAGVINLRGNIIPVIDLPRKLGIPETPLDDKSRIIVFFIGDKLIGMIVDRVERVLRIRQDQIEPAPDIGAGRIQEYITGMGKIDKDLIILLNIDKILTEEEIIQIDDIRRIKQISNDLKTEKKSDKTDTKPDKTQKKSARKGEPVPNKGRKKQKKNH